jgi:general secretion pathway protein C
MIQRYFWLGYLILITAAAALGATMVTSTISAQLSTPIISTPIRTQRPPASQTPPATQDYAIITTRNIFNANPPDPTRTTTPPPKPVITETPRATQLELKLAGTVVGTDNQRYVIIEDLKNRGTQTLYQVGDVIQQARIIEIRPDCMVFDKEGTYESLCFAENLEANQPPRSNAREAALSSPQVSDDMENGIARLDAATWRVSRQVVDEFTDIATLSKMARAQPYVVQGQSQGFRLTRMRRDSLLTQIGLQNGDILQKVNGLGIGSPEDALKAYQQLQQAGTVRLQILRNNRPTTLTYEIR